MRILSVFFMVALGVSTGSTAEAQSDPMAKYRRNLMAGTVDEYRKKVTLQDDDLSAVAIFSTLKAGRIKGHVPMGEGDIMLWAAIDKANGRTLYQVSATIGYWGSWRYYSLASYSSPAGAVQVSPKIDGRNVIACMSAAGCKLEERVSIRVDEELLRSIAASSVPWRFRFQGGGPDWNEEMNPAEASALLAAVDAYKIAHALN